MPPPLRRFLASAVLAGLAAACSSPKEPEPVLVGLQQTAGIAPLFVAQEDGLFQAEGLRAGFVDVGSGSRSIEALAGGSVHIAPATTLSALQAAEQGLDLVIVSPGSFMRTDDVVVNGLVVRSDSPIRSTGDLKARVIGVNDLRGVNYLMTVAMMESGGVSPAAVRFQEVGFPHMAGALDQGRVDAVLTMEPYLSAMRESGRARVLSPGQAVLPALSMACYVAMRPWAVSHTAELRKFSRAYARAVDLTVRDPGRVRRILVTRLKLDPALALRVGLLEFRTSLNRDDIAPLTRLAVRHGLLGREPDLGRLLLSAEPEGER